MDRTELDWTRPDRNYRTGKNRTGLDQTGQDQTRPDQNGSYQSRPDRTRPDIAFLAQKGPFWEIGARKRPAQRTTGIYWKTEGIQSYLGIWGIYDPIETGLSEAKKVGYIGIA